MKASERARDLVEGAIFNYALDVADEAMCKNCDVLAMDSISKAKIMAAVKMEIEAAEHEAANAALEQAAVLIEKDDLENAPDDLYTGRERRAAAIRALRTED